MLDQIVLPESVLATMRRGCAWFEDGRASRIDVRVMVRALTFLAGANATPRDVRDMRAYLDSLGAYRANRSAGDTRVTPWDVAYAIGGGDAADYWTRNLLAEQDERNTNHEYS